MSQRRFITIPQSMDVVLETVFALFRKPTYSDMKHDQSLLRRVVIKKLQFPIKNAVRFNYKPCVIILSRYLFTKALDDLAILADDAVDFLQREKHKRLRLCLYLDDRN